MTHKQNFISRRIKFSIKFFDQIFHCDCGLLLDLKPNTFLLGIHAFTARRTFHQPLENQFFKICSTSKLIKGSPKTTIFKCYPLHLIILYTVVGQTIHAIEIAFIENFFATDISIFIHDSENLFFFKLYFCSFFDSQALFEYIFLHENDVRNVCISLFNFH